MGISSEINQKRTEKADVEKTHWDPQMFLYTLTTSNEIPYFCIQKERV